MAEKKIKIASNKDQSAAEPAPAKDKADEVSGLGNVVIRNEFYRDGYRNLLRLAVLQSLIILGLVGGMYFVIQVHQPENRYFATTEDGRLVPMVALSEPNLSTPALMSWVAQAATEVMTFGFNDYRRRLQEASRNFTRRGWESFTSALQRSRIIEMVEANQQVVTAAPQGAPVLESEGQVAGRYQWVVQVPLIVTFQSGSRTKNDSMLISVVVVRVPRLETPNGVGIEQWIASPR
ncbi:MAG: type IV secretion protein IcmL [Micavibrio sp.]|nr:type IV secretion protein IcmL [Micavibrio sp.]|tara:strand:- start:5891 stop:6595 length:705 start_codon:yes stop_codon:yes gene_type:complete